MTTPAEALAELLGLDPNHTAPELAIEAHRNGDLTITANVFHIDTNGDLATTLRHFTITENQP